MLEILQEPQTYTALLTLTLMEIVLGIDNIIFVAILVARLPYEKQARARSMGIFLALFMRLALLFSITWIMQLKKPLFALLGHAFSGRDLILGAGGLFLLAKSTFEIHHKVEELPDNDKPGMKNSQRNTVLWVIAQIIVLDIVFSLDSVITAVGMSQSILIMVTAMTIAMFVMLVSASSISDFIDRHPTLKILALAFLLLIGVMLVYESMGGHMNKGYIYFAMFFSLGVEFLNMRYRTNSKNGTN